MRLKYSGKYEVLMWALRRVLSLWLLVALVVLHSAAALAAGVIQLPQTGQTKCYNPTTNLEIPCSSASAIGQDGYYQAGVEWPFPRFTNLDGSLPITSIALDRLTGLQWPKNANTPAYMSCSGGTMEWSSALSYVACLNNNNYLGHNGWRLPNIREAMSLLNATEPLPDSWLMSLGFNNVRPTYWTSTTSTDSGGSAWSVSLGPLSNSYTATKTTSYYDVWPVRAGQTGKIRLPQTGQTACYDPITGGIVSCRSTSGQDGNLREGAVWPNPRFTISNGTVTDNLTGLIWLRKAGCALGKMTWPDALSWVATVKDGDCGLTDGSSAGEWRLPNYIELVSLVTYGYVNPALPDAVGTGQMNNGDPFQSVSYQYADDAFSTSTSSGDPATYKRVHFDDGSLMGSPKTTPDFVWLVFDNRKRLTLTSSGTGSGAVTADCTGNCFYPKNSAASLTAVPNSGSYFVWWTNNCSGMNALTTTVMDAPKSCNAVFSSCASPPIRSGLSGITFTAAQGLQTAYDSSLSSSLFGLSDTLALLMTSYQGSLLFDSSHNIVLQGGWDCGHALRWTSPAFINGTITISGGTVEFDRIVIL